MGSSILNWHNERDRHVLIHRGIEAEPSVWMWPASAVEGVRVDEGVYHQGHGGLGTAVNGHSGTMMNNCIHLYRYKGVNSHRLQRCLFTSIKYHCRLLLFQLLREKNSRASHFITINIYLLHTLNIHLCILYTYVYTYAYTDMYTVAHAVTVRS